VVSLELIMRKEWKERGLLWFAAEIAAWLLGRPSARAEPSPSRASTVVPDQGRNGPYQRADQQRDQEDSQACDLGPIDPAMGPGQWGRGRAD
jgi:hypothetical protein